MLQVQQTFCFLPIVLLLVTSCNFITVFNEITEYE
jgi:hypothetical protein